MDNLNRSGALYLTHTRLDGRLVLRLAVGAPATRAEHVVAAWERIVETAETLHTRAGADAARKRRMTGAPAGAERPAARRRRLHRPGRDVDAERAGLHRRRLAAGTPAPGGRAAAVVRDSDPRHRRPPRRRDMSAATDTEIAAIRNPQQGPRAHRQDGTTRCAPGSSPPRTRSPA